MEDIFTKVFGTYEQRLTTALSGGAQFPDRRVSAMPAAFANLALQLCMESLARARDSNY